MFERFTDPARESIVLAQREAGRLRHNYIGTEHLLLGVLRQGTGVGADALGRLQIRLDDVRSDVSRVVGEGQPLDMAGDDAEALRAIGIDLHEVRRRVEDAFGPGALDRAHRMRGRRGRRGKRCAPTGIPWMGSVPFTPRAKKVLELSLREAQRLHHGAIDTEHIVLGLVRDPDGLAAELLAERGASGRRVRSAVNDLLAGRGDLPGRSA